MKPLALILVLLSLAPVTRKGAETLILLSKSTPRTSANVRTVAPASSPMLPTMNTNRVTRAVVRPPAKTNVTVSWTLSQSWLNGEDTRTGLDVSVVLSQLRTGLVGTTNGRNWYPVTNGMAYQASNSVTLPALKWAEMFRAYWGSVK